MILFLYLVGFVVFGILGAIAAELQAQTRTGAVLKATIGTACTVMFFFCLGSFIVEVSVAQ